MGTKFTQKRVANLPFVPAKPGKPARNYTLYWDDKTPGLGVRVTANGARSYIHEARVHGRTVRTTIGKVSAHTLAKAQLEARRLAVDCVDKGIDPRDVAAAERAQAEESCVEAQRQAHEFGGVWASYVAQQARGRKRHYEDHVRLAQVGGERKTGRQGTGLRKAGPLASLMGLKLSELSAAHVEAWLKREGAKRPTSAAQSYRLLRAFIRWANEEPGEGQPDYRGIIPANAYSAKKVKNAVPDSNTKEGDCLQREQLPAWFKAVRALPNPVIAAYLQALLLTGARREELLGLKWADVNLELAPSLTIRDKIDGKRTIPATPFVASLLSKSAAAAEITVGIHEREHGEERPIDGADQGPQRRAGIGRPAAYHVARAARVSPRSPNGPRYPRAP